ncbi:MAG: hypothetical protein CMI31_02105 [Opitutae bacterium]|nr:hypothetical protein [Opitutae bacterium]
MAAIALAFLGCSDNAEIPAEKPILNREDLDRASLKIVTGQTDEARAMLEKLNRKFPDNTEIIELLGLACSEKGDYLEAAFWYEQAADRHPNGASFLKKAGECYELAGEDEFATLSYSAYVALEPDDGHVWHKLYQLRARAAQAQGLPEEKLEQLAKEAINAINKAKVAITPDDALEIAHLLLKINILPVAESYFEEVSINPDGDQCAALLGLLEIYLIQKAGDKVESTARTLCKRFPQNMNSSPLAQQVVQFLVWRHGAALPDPETHSLSELFAGLDDQVVAVNPSPGKLPPDDIVTEDPDPPAPSEQISLAELFGLNPSPEPEESPDQNATSSTKPTTEIDKASDFLQRAELALLDENQRGAKLFLKEAIKEDPNNPQAWYLLSRAHLMANEEEDAEMTATEAVRLASDDLEIRLHFLEAARPVQTARNFLAELDEAHESFPQSLDVLWQLARQYHEVEGKTAVAAILYRRFIGMAPAGHPMLERVRRELDSISNL